MIVFLAYLLIGEGKQAQPDPPGGELLGDLDQHFPDIPRVFPLLPASLSELLYF